MLNTLFANDVRQTLDIFRRSVDQMFDNFDHFNIPTDQTDSSPTPSSVTFSPTIESGWNDQYLNVRAIVPGVEEKDVTVTVQSCQLVIEGVRKAPARYEKNAFLKLPYGRFYTALALPNGMDASQARCQLHDGILDIHIPVPEISKPKQIQIQTAGEERNTIAA